MSLTSRLVQGRFPKRRMVGEKLVDFVEAEKDQAGKGR